MQRIRVSLHGACRQTQETFHEVPDTVSDRDARRSLRRADDRHRGASRRPHHEEPDADYNNAAANHTANNDNSPASKTSAMSYAAQVEIGF